MPDEMDGILEGVQEEIAGILKTAVVRRYDSFAKMGPDTQEPVLSVLRVHLLTEYNIERFFHALLPRADKIADASLSYSQKLALLESLDELDDRTIQCLKGLNRVRNRCAHEHDKTITVADVELIGRPLGKEHTQIRNEHVDNTHDYLKAVLSAICRNIISQITWLEHADKLSDDEPEDAIQQEDDGV